MYSEEEKIRVRTLIDLEELPLSQEDELIWHEICMETSPEELALEIFGNV